MYSSYTTLGGFVALPRPFRNHSAGTALIIVSGNGSGCAMNIQCQAPMARFFVYGGPRVIIRQHVQEAELHDPIRVIEGHPVAQAGAAVVPGKEETLVAKALHDLDHVLRHDTEAVVDVIRSRLRQPAV